MYISYKPTAYDGLQLLRRTAASGVERTREAPGEAERPHDTTGRGVENRSVERSDRKEFGLLALACVVGCSVPMLLLGGLTASGAVAIAGDYGGLWLALGVALFCVAMLVVRIFRTRRDGCAGEPEGTAAVPRSSRRLPC